MVLSHRTRVQIPVAVVGAGSARELGLESHPVGFGGREYVQPPGPRVGASGIPLEAIFLKILLTKCDSMIIVWSIIGIALFLLISGLRVIDQYERGVILTLGKYTGTRSPGLRWIFPVIQRMIKIDLRITTIDIPQQEVITKDNVPVGINAVVYFQVEVDPHRHVVLGN